MPLLTYEDFISLSSRDDKYAQIKKSLQSGKRFIPYIVGPPDPLKTFILTALGNDLSRKPWVLVSDELKARSLAAEIAGYGDKRVVVFRQRELNLLDTYASSRESELERLAVTFRLLSGNYDVCLVTAAASMSKLMPVKDFMSLCFTLNLDGEFKIEDVSAKLVATGYERVQMTDSPGQFSIRGDLIDIILPEEILSSSSGKTGIRISFFDDSIDAIKRFDINTQRSVEMLREIAIYPAREVIIQDNCLEDIIAKVDAQESGGARAVKIHDLEKIEQGSYFSVADRYISIIYPDAESIFDYIDLKTVLLAVDELNFISNRMDSYLADFYERFKSLILREKILPCSEDVLFKGIDILTKIEKMWQVCYFAVIPSTKGMPRDAVEFNIASKETMSYRGKEKDLAAQIRERNNNGEKTVIMISDVEKRRRLSEFLATEGISPEYAPVTVENGFEYTAANVLFIGSEQIFSAARRLKKKNKKGISIDLFSDLRPGDLVVHEIHGVGKYMGLVNIDSNGSKRDYLKIEYAKADTLYIPMEALDQIQKYVGSQGKEPHLSKLGGQEWSRLKEKAKASIKILATNLVKLYAERMAIKGFKFSPDTVWQREFEDEFEYDETNDQLRSIEEIKADMESDKVMDRLLCGDVGFGKTEVAFRAVFKCVMDGRQAAILAPTTVLAQQHFENLQERLKDFPVRVGLLSRFASDAMIKETKREIAKGSLEIVIGTHRLLSKDVNFKDLGLLVIDEEQRFGVDHKERLKERFPSVDVLTLTATPIPRTLHMSMAGIRDISVLEEPPVDRRAVQTYVMEYDEGIVAEAMLREISRQGQVFYLFNNTSRIIEKVKAIEKMLPGAKIIHAHGKMHEKELEDAISFFLHGNADILVCTTIIESGIDMPNVNTIIVEDADRLGLAQLYQLRGRVGRSQRQAFSYITYRQDKVLTEVSQKRLAAIRDYTELGSGFKIALRDLEVRGAGNLLGGEQHGNMDAIGYDLYCKMLEEEINSQTGERPAERFDASVELEIDAYIPKSYVPDEGQRMDMYRRVSGINSETAYIDALDELSDRYGEMPPQIVTLADIAYIRNFAAHLGFAKIREQSGTILLYYRENFSPDMEMLSFLLNHPAYKGKVLFNAQTKPYIALRNAAVPLSKAPENIRKMFLEIERFEK
jgi:transcription-repair coupling factor (superfamily II helicase)